MLKRTSLPNEPDRHRVTTRRGASFVSNCNVEKQRDCIGNRHRFPGNRGGKHCKSLQLPCATHVIRRLPAAVTFSCNCTARCPMDWHAACRNTPALRRRGRDKRHETGRKNPVPRRQESIRKIARKELAPGGHQEQGESRVTVFRAPDWEKTSGARVAKERSRLPFGERVSAVADERHLKDSDDPRGAFRQNRRRGNELQRHDQRRMGRSPSAP